MSAHKVAFSKVSAGTKWAFDRVQPDCPPCKLSSLREAGNRHIRRGVYLKSIGDFSKDMSLPRSFDFQERRNMQVPLGGKTLKLPRQEYTDEFKELAAKHVRKGLVPAAGTGAGTDRTETA